MSSLCAWACMTHEMINRLVLYADLHTRLVLGIGHCAKDKYFLGVNIEKLKTLLGANEVMFTFSGRASEGGESFVDTGRIV